MQAVETPSVRSPSVGYWISLFLVPCVFLAIMAVVDRAPPIDPALLRAKFRVVVSDSEQPPPFRRMSRPKISPATWTTRRWTPTTSRASGTRSRSKRNAAPQGLWAVYLPWSYGTYAVYVNGAPIGESSPMRPPYAFFRTPLYFEFSSALLRPGVNKVELRLVSVRYAAYMFPFYRRSCAKHRAGVRVCEFPACHAGPCRDHCDAADLAADTRPVLGTPCRNRLPAGLRAATLCWAAYNALLLEARILIPPAGSVDCAAADRARMVLDLLRAVHQSAARLRRPTAADGARAARLRRDRLR